jgi:YD repeat-containing protein
MVFPPEVDTTIGPPNNNNGGIPGTIVGSFSVSPSGAANYNIPLSSPGGTNGLAPGLSLNYSSQGGDGIMGDGWSVGGLSIISRVPYTYYYNNNTQTITFSNNSQLVLDGAHLIKVGDYEYRTESESFSKIVRISNNTINDGFIVYKKNGMIYKYGSGANSRQMLQTKPSPVAWYIDTIFDASGNYISFHYFNDPDNGYIYPDYIKYTGNTTTGNNPYYKIEFTYENRDDTPKLYFYNGATGGDILFSKTTKRLLNIKCKYIPQNSTITEYRLNYEQKGFFNKHFLIDITQYDLDENYFNPTKFEWENNTYNPKNSGTYGSFNESQNETSKVLLTGDFNHDGMADAINYTEVSANKYRFHIHLNTNNAGIYNETAEDYYEIECGTDEIIVDVNTGDFNGDGVTDILYVSADLQENYTSHILYCNYNESSHQFDFTTNQIFTLFSSTHKPFYIIGDFTGNGLSDCFVLKVNPDGGNDCILRHSKPNSPLGSSTGKYIDDIWHTSRFLVNDFDGDFKSELLIYNYDNARIIEYVKPIPEHLSVTNAPTDFYYAYNEKLVTGDFNADGKGDIVLFKTSEEENNCIIYFSHGNGFNPSDTLTVIKPSGAKVFAFDLNDDSRTDIAFLKIVETMPGIEVINRYDYITTPSGNDFIQCSPFVLGLYSSFNNLNIIWGEIYNVGFKDVLIFETQTCNWKYKADKNNFYCNAINKITNGFGKETKINYKPFLNSDGYAKGEEEDFPVHLFTGSTNVVTDYEVDNGNNEFILTDFEYKGAKYHKIGKGFLGFEEFTSENYKTGIKKTMYFSHNNEFYNIQKDSVKLWLMQNGNLAKRLINTYEYYSDYIEDRRYFTYVDTTTIEKFEINGALKDHFRQLTTYEFNSDDLPIKIITEARNELNNEWINKYSEKLLLNITAGNKWILGLTESILTRHTSYDATLIERITVKLYYQTTGYLRKIILEPGNSKGNTTTYFYDDFGNVIQTKLSATGMNDRNSYSTYSSNGRFLLSSQNALNHETEYEYYTKTGSLKKVIDENDLETTNYYDGFGRKIKTVNPAGLISANTTIWAQGHPDAPQKALYYAWAQSSGNPETIMFFDKLGRELLSVNIGFDGDKIYKKQEYYYSNYLCGLIKNVSKPFYYDDNIYRTEFTYDKKRRKETITYPDNRTVTYNYGVKQVTTTEIEGFTTRQHTKKFDAASRLKLSKDDINNKSVEYKYYSNGLQKSTKVIGNINTEIINTYDIFGNALTIDDPDLGIQSFIYNPFGELTSETDANTHTTTYSYDLLGRITERIEDDGATQWYYDTQNNGIGKIDYITCSFTDYNGLTTSSAENYYYDAKGRVSNRIQNIDGTDYEVSYTYDVLSRQKEMTYPSGYKIWNKFNGQGFLGKIKNGNTTLWEAKEINAQGQIEEYDLGNNVTSTRSYLPANGRLSNITTGKNTPGDLQNLQYEWYKIGNMRYRLDINKGIFEHFYYDNYDRLTEVALNYSSQMNIDYNDIGNIENKTDVGEYIYGENNAGPHAVSSISSNPPSINDDDQDIFYTSFDKIVKIYEDPYTLNMAYGYNHQRIKQTITDDVGNQTIKTYLFGGLYEKIEKSDGTIKELNYLSSPVGTFAIVTIDNEMNETLYPLKEWW